MDSQNVYLNLLLFTRSFGSTSSEGTTTDEKKEPPVKEEIEDAWKEEKETLIKEKAELKVYFKIYYSLLKYIYFL